MNVGRREVATGATTLVAGVPVVHWNPVRAGAPVANFGDVLGPALVARIIAGTDREPSREPVRTLTSVGSIAHLAPEYSVLWGTGVNGKVLPDRGSFPASLDVRSVRGPWTRRYLRWLGYDVPEIYGDPALLVPYLMPELVQTVRAPRRDTLFVPNINDLDELSAQAGALGVPVQDPCEQLYSVLAEIATSRFVIGSSLHAVVVAESLGIPARFVRSVHEHPFKYRDYLAGTGRWTEPVAETVDEAMAMGPMPEPRYDAEAIMDAFPRDLWSRDEVSPARQTRSTAARTTAAAAVAEEISPGEGVGDSEWVAALSDGATSDLEGMAYEAVLREAVGSAAAGRPTAGLSRLADLRRWIHTEVRAERLAGDLRDADRALFAGSIDGFLDASRRAGEGLVAQAYAVFRRPGSAVLSVAVRLVDSGRAIEEVRLNRGDEAVVVRGVLLPVGGFQLDLDVIVPAVWGDPAEAELRVGVVYADGATETAVLTWVDEVPRLGVAREKSMAAVGQEGV